MLPEEVNGYFAEMGRIAVALGSAAREVLETVIPRSVRIAEAPSYGQTVLSYQLASVGAQQYLKAAQEIAARGVQQQ